MTNTNYATVPGKSARVTYWITTGLVLFELMYGATWDFNWLNKGFAAGVMAHLGYPPYLPSILGMSKIIAAICIASPGLGRVKEWAYTGVVILFAGAVCSHIIVGDHFSTLVFPAICIALTIASYVLRPATRRI
jgi:hypothetical protein